MRTKSLNELGGWFLLISIIITLILCIPLNIKYKNNFIEYFNIPKTIEKKEYKEFRICTMWVYCDRGEIIGSKTVSNDAIGYLCMFFVEFIVSFIFYLWLWIVFVKKIVILSKKELS